MPRQRADSGESHIYTYDGPAKTFRAAAGADPIGRGDKVSLTNAQVRALVQAGHSFSADSQVGNETIEAAVEAQRVERHRLEAEAAAKRQAGG